MSASTSKEMNETAEDLEEEIFSDVSPLNDEGRESIRMSRMTIYHSAIDLMPSEEGLFKSSTALDYPVSYYPKVTYFRDGVRSIDFILVWIEETDLALKEMNKARRRIFETQLIDDGLELELDGIGRALRIVKVHAPTNVLRTYCDVLGLRMPIKEIPRDFQRTRSLVEDNRATGLQALLGNFSTNLPSIPAVRSFLTTAYSKEKSYLFDEEDDYFFTPLVKIMVVNYMLERAGMNTNTAGHMLTNVGVRNMVNDGVYRAVYPLHDGSVDDATSLRGLLVREWGTLRKTFNFQPVDHIKEYMGAEIAMYFTWLGFYTTMLVPAAVIGACCFLYGCFTLASDPLSSEVCNSSTEFVMCPRCEQNCDYWRMDELCPQGKLTYTIDNLSMIPFSIFMSIWATVYLKLWKRYSASIAHRWSATGCSPCNQHPRPEYLVKLSSDRRTKTRKNVVMDVKEPYIPFWRVRLPQTLLGFSLLASSILLALVAVLSIVFYRISLIAAVNVFSPSAPMNYLPLECLITAAVFNLVLTLTSNCVYRKIARSLTESELWRTQNEFDENYALKILLIEFVNFFTSISYIAFIKGKFIGHPGSFYRIFGVRLDECNSPVGCMFELTVQLATTLLGLQFLNGLFQMIAPMASICLAKFKARNAPEAPALRNRENHVWTEDYKLLEYSTQRLFGEYLEIVVQYGFITIFAVAFPLAPLIALINNILEVRLDARKLLTFYRRPVPCTAPDIGIWYEVLSGIGKVAIFSNAIIIAFTSTLIPQLVHEYSESSEGFLAASLGAFNATAFEPRSGSSWSVSSCRYPSLDRSEAFYWHVIAARLIFVVVFYASVSLTVTLVAWLIPDISPVVRDRIKTEEFLTSQSIIQHEARVRKRNATTSLEHKEIPKQQGSPSTNHIRFSLDERS